MIKQNDNIKEISMYYFKKPKKEFNVWKLIVILAGVALAVVGAAVIVSKLCKKKDECCEDGCDCCDCCDDMLDLEGLEDCDFCLCDDEEEAPEAEPEMA